MYSANEVSFSGISSNELSQKFGIVAELGQGGMSVVHLATSRNLGNVQKLVVLKSIRPEMLSNEKVRRMFMDEARLVVRLTHPNIVQTYEVVTIGERPVIVMEYMEGQSFSQVQRVAHEKQVATGHGGLSLAMKLRVIIDALSGMQYAHDLSDYDGRPLGLVHRDISPQNVFVTYDGHVKILDFGIAKALDNSGQTEAGEIKGKIRYMPPEQMQGALDLDRRADVYALGVMLWEALTGQRLWHGVSDVEVFRTVQHQGIPTPRSVVPDVNPLLEAICLKAVARDLSVRYESCAAMQADLERACDELGLRASNKQLGLLLQELFAERRTAIRRAIEQKLKAIDSEPLDLKFHDVTSNSGSLATRAQLRTGTTSAVELFVEEPKRRWPWVAVILLLVLGAGGWAALNGKVPGVDLRSLTAQATPAPVSAPAAAAPVAAVSVRFSASPPEATLFLDGAALATNPFVAELPRDTVRHELRAEAAGHAPRSVAVWLNGGGPVETTLTLEKPSTPTPAQPAVRTAPRARSVATGIKAPGGAKAPAGSAGPSCEHPFVVDASGIRRVRPECL